MSRFLDLRNVFPEGSRRTLTTSHPLRSADRMDPRQQKQTDLQSTIQYNIGDTERTSKSSPTQSRQALHGEQAHEAR